MLVTISDASRMVGVKSRSTFYRHIKKKGISVTKDEEGNPKIDTAELIRVYGDKVSLPGKEKGQGIEIQKQEKSNTDTKQLDQNNTPSSGKINVQSEIGILQEKVKRFEELYSMQEKERRSERDLLNDQIETLKKALDGSQDQQKRLTLLITDQREDKNTKEDVQENRIKNLEQMIMDLKAQNDKLAKIEEERRKRMEERRRQKEEEKQKSIFSKIFGGGG